MEYLGTPCRVLASSWSDSSLVFTYTVGVGNTLILQGLVGVTYALDGMTTGSQLAIQAAGYLIYVQTQYSTAYQSIEDAFGNIPVFEGETVDMSIVADFAAQWEVVMYGILIPAGGIFAGSSI